MRITTLFLLAATAFAQDGDGREADPFVTAMQIFEAAKSKSTEPGARAVLHPAVDRLVETGDPRAIQPLCTFLIQTHLLESALLSEIKKVQRVGADADDRITTLDKELAQLRLKERAGDTRVGPQIEKRLEETRRLQQTFQRVMNDVNRLHRQATFIVELRERLAQGCITILAAAKSPAVIDAGFTQLRRALDIADRTQALYCVRILRGSKQPAAEEHLVQILAHPKVSDPVARAATLALGAVLSKRSARVLLERWRRDPERYGTDVQYALSIAARKRLADPDAAAEWIDSLPE